MNDRRQSDGPIVLRKLANKGRGGPRPAERVDGTGLAKRNPARQSSRRYQRQTRLQRAPAGYGQGGVVSMPRLPGRLKAAAV